MNNLAVGYVSMFLLFFPRTWLEKVLLAETNKHLEVKMSLGKLLRFIGLWLFMATVSGYTRQEFFSAKPISVNCGAPYRLHPWMSGKRFEAIHAALRYTTAQPPTAEQAPNKFWEVTEMIAAWNKNMATIFMASWVSCLDKSMSILFNQWTCPGWVIYPRKPHPFGNEYHSICCGLSGIMFVIELVMGTDSPIPSYHDPTNAKGNTVGLLLRLFKSLYSSGKS